mgnify:CR=1 FL=1
MFTIKQKTRIRSDLCYEVGYEIRSEDGSIIYNFADDDTMRKFEEANRKEIANQADIAEETASDRRDIAIQVDTLEHWCHNNPVLSDGTMVVMLKPNGTNYLVVGDGKTSIIDMDWMSMRALKAIKKNWDVASGLIDYYAEDDKDE